MADPQAPAATSPTITDVPSTAKERIGTALGGGYNLADEMTKQHTQRLNQAKIHQQNMITAMQAIYSGKSPTSGQPLTDDEKQYFNDMYKQGSEGYAKVAGVSPAAKKLIAQHQAMTDHVVAIGQQRQAQGQPGQGGGMTPPPGATGAGAGVAQGAMAGLEGAAGGAAAPAAAAAGVAPGAAAGGMTAPPGMSQSPAKKKMPGTPEDTPAAMSSTTSKLNPDLPLAAGGANGGGVPPTTSKGTTPPAKTSLINKIKTSLKKFQSDGIDYSPGTPEEMVAPLIRQEMADNRQVALVGREYGAQEAEAVKGKLDAERKGIEQRIQMVAEHPDWGLKPGSPQYLQFISGGRIGGGAGGLKSTPLQRAVQGSAILASDPDMTTEAGSPIDPSKTYDVMQHPDGSSFAMESGQTAGMRTPSTKYMPGGPPAGIQEGGKFKTPDSKDWTADNQKELDAMQKSYDVGIQHKKEMQELYAESRAKAYSQSKAVSIYNTEENRLEEVSVWDIVHSPPGKYVAAGAAMKLKLAESTFKEIGFTTDTVNAAIKALPNDAFDAPARAQMALVLKGETKDEIASSWDLFKDSTVAGSLSEEQMNYVTALKDLAETAATLRAAGQGATSDRMRGLIQGMLPGAGTPSRVYAERQMKLFSQEVAQLHTALPRMGEAKQGAGMTAPPAATGGAATPAAPTTAPKTWAELKKQSAAQQQAPPQ